ncbi:MAG TPA: hypothetical protein VFV87_02075, partial [Pirellulaceae bacterium]|nr:hypothetical protein [Pirellulaceae bacterium]
VPGQSYYHVLLGQVLLKGPDGYSQGIAEFEEANRLSPDKSYFAYRLGNAYARWGRWREAAPLLRRASDTWPTDRWNAYHHAILSAYVGDMESYRLACRRLLDADKPDGADLGPYNAAIACLLAPDGIGQSDRIRELAIEEQAERLNDRRKANARALAQLRAGQWRSAIDELGTVPTEPNGARNHLTSLAILAMAQQGSGDLPAAKQSLATAKSLRAATWPYPEQGRPFGEFWQNWLLAEILLREAEGLIAPPAQAQQAPP